MSKKPFVNKQTRLRAIGATDRRMPPIFRDELFVPQTIPRPGDWLEEHYEPGQTFSQFQSYGRFPTRSNSTIYIQPLGIISQEILSFLVQFCSSFFQNANVSLLSPLRLSKIKVAKRENDYGTQYNALDLIKAIKIPKGAFCVLGITMYDLYPSESWNFVYGLASGTKGVFSFRRYIPSVEDSPESFQKICYKGCKTMVHEISHMFGIKHCIYYKCLLNGNNGNESSKPHLCPVCLKKLHHALKFNIKERFEQLASVVSQMSSPSFQKLLAYYVQMIELCNNQ